MSDAFNARKGKGRPKGSPNKVTRELRAMAAQYTKKGVKALAEIAFSKSGGEYVYDVDARKDAIDKLMNRAHGKAPIAVTGEGGEGPITITRIERVIVDVPKRDEGK